MPFNKPDAKEIHLEPRSVQKAISYQFLMGSYSPRHGYGSALRLIDESPNFTAIVCGDDMIAFGAMAGFKSRGLRIPEDLAEAVPRPTKSWPRNSSCAAARTQAVLPLHKAHPTNSRSER